jgi:hypothetical protein
MNMRNLLKGSKLWGVVMSLFVVGSLSAQDVPYTPFNFEGNPKWTDNAFWAGFGFEAMSTVTWKIDGSEVIDSTLYFNLFAKEVCNYGPPGRFDHFGYVRESEDRKVYFIPIDEEWYMYGICDLNVGQEYIIYDFNITVGDSLESFISPEFYILPGAIGFIVLDSIQSIQVDLEYRNAYYFSSTDITNEKWMWVEGIGGDRGLIRPTFPYSGANNCSSQWEPINPYTNILTCYDDNEISYQNQYLDIWQGHLSWGFAEEGSFIDDNCNLILSQDDVYDIQLNVSALPNPMTDMLRLDCDVAIVDVDVYDLNGRIVLNYCNLNLATVRLNVADLSKGVYILDIALINGAQASKKVVKR